MPKYGILITALFLSACSTPVNLPPLNAESPQANESVKSEHPKEETSQTEANNSENPPAKEEQPEEQKAPENQKVNLSVTLDASQLTSEELTLLKGQAITLTLTSEELDGPLPEPVALINLDDLDKIPHQRMPLPIFEFEQKGQLEDTFEFKVLPAQAAFSIGSDSIFIKSERDCWGPPKQTYVSAFQEVTGLNTNQSIVLSLSSHTIQDLSAIESTTVHGKVTDSKGNPIKGAKITLQAVDAELDPCLENIYRGESDAEGLYQIHRLRAGIRYWVTVEKGNDSKKEVIILGSNKSGDPDINRHNVFLDPQK